MLHHLLSADYLHYLYLSFTMPFKILCIIFLYELYLLAILFDVIERLDEEYYRDDWIDEVVDNFLEEFENDAPIQYEVEYIHHT